MRTKSIQKSFMKFVALFLTGWLLTLGIIVGRTAKDDERLLVEHTQIPNCDIVVGVINSNRSQYGIPYLFSYVCDNPPFGISAHFGSYPGGPYEIRILSASVDGKAMAFKDSLELERIDPLGLGEFEHLFFLDLREAIPDDASVRHSLVLVGEYMLDSKTDTFEIHLDTPRITWQTKVSCGWAALLYYSQF